MDEINYDSMNTHAHTAATVFIVTTHTTVYAFHHPHSHIIPWVLVSSSIMLGLLWSSTECLPGSSAVENTLCRMKKNSVNCGFLWLVWLVYGSIWEQDHCYGGTSGYIVTSVYVVLGLWCTVRVVQSQTVYYALVLGCYALLLYTPPISGVSQYMPGPDLMVRVMAYVLTYFLNLYVRLMLDSTVDGAYLLTTTTWILMVNKWMLPLVGLHWMAQLRRMVSIYSQRPNEDATVLPSHRQKHATPVVVTASPPAAAAAQNQGLAAIPQHQQRRTHHNQRSTSRFFKSVSGGGGAPDRLVKAAAGIGAI
jgi:hypothetical protein